MSNARFVYFGGEPLGVPVLEELKASGLLPALIVANPDRPSGRGKKLTAPPVKIWAEEHNIPVWQPTNLADQSFITEKLSAFDLFVVVAYNKIMPEWLIELPLHKTINVHPSMLPLYRGASPIRSAILEDNRAAIGVSIMLMDKKMDHGPLLAQKAMPIADQNWPIDGRQLDTALAQLGGALLAATIPEWTRGSITPTPQVHENATYCGKLTKDMGKLHIDPHNLPTGEAAKAALLKIRAFAGFPGTFFYHHGTRFKIVDATISSQNTLEILQVIPEGKRATDFKSYQF